MGKSLLALSFSMVGVTIKYFSYLIVLIELEVHIIEIIELSLTFFDFD